MFAWISFADLQPEKYSEFIGRKILENISWISSKFAGCYSLLLHETDFSVYSENISIAAEAFLNPNQLLLGLILFIDSIEHWYCQVARKEKRRKVN